MSNWLAADESVLSDVDVSSADALAVSEDVAELALVELEGGGPGGGGGGPFCRLFAPSDESSDMLLSRLVRSDAISCVVTADVVDEAAATPVLLLVVLLPVVLLLASVVLASVVPDGPLEDAVDCRLSKNDCKSVTSFEAASSVLEDESSLDDESDEPLTDGGGPCGNGGGPDAAVVLLWSVLLDWEDCSSFMIWYCDRPLLLLNAEMDMVGSFGKGDAWS